MLNRIQGLNSLRHVLAHLHTSWTWVDEHIEGLPAESSMVHMAAPLYQLSLTKQPPGRVMATSWKRFKGASDLPSWFFEKDKTRSGDPRELIPPLDWIRHVAKHAAPAQRKSLELSRSAATSHKGYAEIEVATEAEAKAVASAYGPLGALPVCETAIKKGRNSVTVTVYFGEQRTDQKALLATRLQDNFKN